MAKTDPEVSYTNQVSISSTFYARIFRTKKLQSQNVSRKKTFVQKKRAHNVDEIDCRLWKEEIH